MSTPEAVDLYTIEVIENVYPPRTIWLAYLPGSANSFDIPALGPDYSGSALLYIDAVRSKYPFDFNQFSSLDLRLNRIHAWSSQMSQISLP
jgi:hypothetical protein